MKIAYVICFAKF